MQKMTKRRFVLGALAVLLAISHSLTVFVSAAQSLVLPDGSVAVETLPPTETTGPEDLPVPTETTGPEELPVPTEATEPEEQPVPTDPMEPTVPAEKPLSGTVGKNLTWNLDTDGVLTISGSGEMADFSGMGWRPYNEQIVAVVIEPGVTSISNGAFQECKMESVVIPEGVTTIAETAFWNCEALRSITLPDSVTDVGATPFQNCTSLTGIWVGKGNKHYSSDGYGVLFDKNQTTLIKAPKTLTQYAIPKSVTRIKGGAFQLCTALTDVTIPGSVESIGGYAFSGTGLTSVTIPAGVTLIGDSAFYCCSNLTGIHVDAANPQYSSDASGVLFDKNKTLLIQAPGTITQYEIPDSVRTIGKYAFADCFRLSSISIPDSVTSIVKVAFSGTALKQVTIPGSVRNIGWGTFMNCSALQSVTFEGDAPVFEEDRLFGGVTATVYYPAGNATWTKDILQNYGGNITWRSYTDYSGLQFPASATVKTRLNVRKEPSVTSAMVKRLEIGERVEILEIVTANGQDWGRITDGWIMMYYVDLDGNSTTTGGTCGENLTWTFDKNTGVLTISGTGEMYDYDHDSGPWEDKVVHVVVESGVTSIGNYAFFFTDTLKTVTMADSVRSIGEMAFANCRNLSSADLPKNLVSIGWQTFWDTNIRSVYIPATVTRIGDGAFAGNHASKDITVAEGNPSYLVEDGILFTKNKDALLYYPPAKTDQQYVVPGEVRRIGERAFSGNEYLTSVEISEGTREIGWLGFEYCTNLSSVMLPSTLTDIGSCAFIFTGLQEITIPGNVTKIGSIAFYYCTSLWKLTFQGDAPTFERAYPIVEDTFTNVNAVAYYPAGNATWTEAVMQDYGGNITWLPYGAEDTDHTPGTKWYSNSKEHWKKCTDCNHKVELAPHVPGPEATRYSAQRCLICDRVINNPKALDWVVTATGDPDASNWATGYYTDIQNAFGYGQDSK